MTAQPPAQAGMAAAPGGLLVIAIVLCALTEAMAGTALSLSRGDLIGDLHATPDEFAWLDGAYGSMKLLGFVLAPWLAGQLNPRRLMTSSTLLMGFACAAAALGGGLEAQVPLRAVQGLAGGVLLVGGQLVLFEAFERARQPLIQAFFAMGAVVAPATLAPALQGWLLEVTSWKWIFLTVAPLSLAAAGMLFWARMPPRPVDDRRAFDPLGLVLVGAAFSCLTFVLSQGSRWDWFEAGRIRWSAGLGLACLLGFAGQQLLARRRGLLDYRAFKTEHFTFAFVVSFVAGAALLASAYLIPAFAVSQLGFSPIAAGLLLLPSGGLFIAALLLAAYLMQARGLPPIATVPFGILLLVTAMWRLGGSTAESGASAMMGAVLIRGFGLGLLFLSITLIGFGALARPARASAIGLFNVGRQLGGLMGVAGLQTLIDDQLAGNRAVLAANLTLGAPSAGRLAATADLLAARGLEPTAASRVAAGLLGKTVADQAAVIAFATAFNTIALMFVFAAPVLIAVKIGLGRASRAR